MRIQVTNDDGIESEGLQVLVRRLAATEHEIVVVAPDRDWSGASSALGALGPDLQLDTRRVEIDGAPTVEAWSLAGPPALTVIAGQLGAFGPPPELIVSGINAGLNTGRSVLHSGTIGAALAAQNFGRSGLAVSVADSDPWQWQTAAELAVELLGLIVDAPARSVLNLNVPALRYADVLGTKWGRLAPFGAVRTAISGAADGRLQFELTATGYDPAPDTDQGIVEAGYASLTTLVGVTEAWGVPRGDVDGIGAAPPSLEEHIVPGATLHPVHRVPDASTTESLRRPLIGEVRRRDVSGG